MVAYEVNVTTVPSEQNRAPAAIVSSIHHHRFAHSNGKTKSIRITNTDPSHETTAVFTRLTPSTEYKVQVTLRNENGIGPPVVSYAETKQANTGT